MAIRRTLPAVAAVSLLVACSAGSAPTEPLQPLGPPTLVAEVGGVSSAPLAAAGDPGSAYRWEIEPVAVLAPQESPSRRIRFKWCLRRQDGTALTLDSVMSDGKPVQPSDETSADDTTHTFRYRDGDTDRWARWRLRITDERHVSCWVTDGTGAPPSAEK